MSTARSRDRRVYLLSHPVLFGLLALTRRWPAVRLGGTVLVHDREAYVAALTRIPLDRTAEGTTGGAVDRLTGAGGLFDQQGDEHRRTRRSTAEALGAAGVARLRPVWTDVLDRRLAPLADGHEVDLVPVAAELAGATAAALLGLRVDPLSLTEAALAASAAAARAHLPGWGRRRAARRAATAAERLSSLTGRGDTGGLATMLAVAAITTTVAALPRAAAWAADADLWEHVDDHRPELVDELLRVLAPTPLLPRVAAGPGDLRPATPAPRPVPHPEPGGPTMAHPTDDPRPPSTGGCPVRLGDRLLLIARHAVDAHHAGPDPLTPADPRLTQLIFGAGRHACPGASLARAQMADLLAALAPYRPVVVSARADRRSALPGWRRLTVGPAPIRRRSAPVRG